MSRDQESILAIFIAAILWTLLGLRFQKLRYSAPAFFAVALGIVAARYRDWFIVGVSVAIALLFGAIDAFRKRPEKDQQRR